MHETPRIASQAEVSWICSTILFHMAVKVAPDALMPRRSLICEVTMIRATADVNPELTGPETKSMRKPERKKEKKTNKID